MKKTTIFRLGLLVLLALVVSFSLVSCVSADTDKADGLTESFLDLLLADDYENAFELINETVSDSDFREYWKVMRTAAADADSYKMERLGWNVNYSDGTVYQSFNYEIVLNNERTLFVRTTLTEGVENIAGIYFNDTTEFYATYGVAANIIGVILLVFTLLSTALTVWMLVDCIKRKIKLKALWIILIILSIGLSITVGQQFGFNLSFGLFFAFSSAVADPATMSITVKALFPLGAVIYFFVRKVLTVTPPAAPEAAEIVEGTVADEATEATENAEN